MPLQALLQLQLNSILFVILEGREDARGGFEEDRHQDAAFESAYEGQFVIYTKNLVMFTSGGRIG
jgi:hypothetical protein